MNKELFLELQKEDLSCQDCLTKATEQIKALSRDAQGVFDFGALTADFWKVAAVVYPIYTKYETEINKKAGYPDIMSQMRVLKKRAYEQFETGTVLGYLEVLIGVIETISPEIYENYRELVDDFRETMKEAIEAFGWENYATGNLPDIEEVMEKVKKTDLAASLVDILERAFAKKVLLREKYQALADAFRG